MVWAQAPWSPSRAAFCSCTGVAAPLPRWDPPTKFIVHIVQCTAASLSHLHTIAPQSAESTGDPDPESRQGLSPCAPVAARQHRRHLRPSASRRRRLDAPPAHRARAGRLARPIRLRPGILPAGGGGAATAAIRVRQPGPHPRARSESPRAGSRATTTIPTAATTTTCRARSGPPLQ